MKTIFEFINKTHIKASHEYVVILPLGKLMWNFIDIDDDNEWPSSFSEHYSIENRTDIFYILIKNEFLDYYNNDWSGVIPCGYVMYEIPKSLNKNKLIEYSQKKQYDKLDFKKDFNEIQRDIQQRDNT